MRQLGRHIGKRRGDYLRLRERRRWRRLENEPRGSARRRRRVPGRIALEDQEREREGIAQADEEEFAGDGDGHRDVALLEGSLERGVW